MLVILKEDIPHLGEIGEVVKVSDGYARNFLLPRQLVVQADQNNLAQLDHHKRILEKKKELVRNDAQSLAEKIESVTLTFRRKVGKNEKLFGSVTNNDIADELAKSGFEIEKSSIVVKEPIKTLGEHSVEVKLHTSVSAKLQLIVAQEEE